MIAALRHRPARLAAAVAVAILVASLLAIVRPGNPATAAAGNATQRSPGAVDHDAGAQASDVDGAPSQRAEHARGSNNANGVGNVGRAGNGGPGSAEPGLAAANADAARVHPANRPQTSLVDAASQVHGRGIKRPAAGITGGQRRAPVDPDDVLSRTGARGGCIPEYGEGGQCLPARHPSANASAKATANFARTWTCADVREVFPEGISTTDDPLDLDTDGDGTACGPTD